MAFGVLLAVARVNAQPVAPGVAHVTLLPVVHLGPGAVERVPGLRCRPAGRTREGSPPARCTAATWPNARSSMLLGRLPPDRRHDARSRLGR
jgi:hypothetical protein